MWIVCVLFVICIGLSLTRGEIAKTIGHNKVYLLIFTIFSMLLICLMYILNFDRLIFKNIIFLPLGGMFYYMRNKVEIPYGKWILTVLVVMLVSLICLLAIPGQGDFVVKTLGNTSISVAILLVLVSLLKRVTLKSNFLDSLGNLSMEIYIIHFPVLMILKNSGITNAEVLPMLTLVITILVSIPFKKGCKLITHNNGDCRRV